jgi:hypothetical protein
MFYCRSKKYRREGGTQYDWITEVFEREWHWNQMWKDWQTLAETHTGGHEEPYLGMVSNSLFLCPCLKALRLVSVH